MPVSREPSLQTAGTIRVLSTEEEEVRESKFGPLRFGDKFSLTRTDEHPAKRDGDACFYHIISINQRESYTTMAQDYNKTLNLPQTDFAMRASLPQREPGMLAEWNEENLYQKMVDRNEGKPTYILHDGPPYANGDIHLGTALNKVLKI